MTLDLDTLKRILRSIADAHPGEIGCGTCLDQLDTFAEMRLAGRDAAEAMPLVEEHLIHCDDCHQEFEALLSALRHFGREDDGRTT